MSFLATLLFDFLAWLFGVEGVSLWVEDLDGVPLEIELLSALGSDCKPSLTIAELSFCTSDADQISFFLLP